jgi:transketolase N-terminal domain/subunit
MNPTSDRRGPHMNANELKELNHDPTNPAWPERDRVFWSAGHKAAALYVALGRQVIFRWMMWRYGVSWDRNSKDTRTA